MKPAGIRTTNVDRRAEADAISVYQASRRGCAGTLRPQVSSSSKFVGAIDEANGLLRQGAGFLCALSRPCGSQRLESLVRSLLRARLIASGHGVPVRCESLEVGAAQALEIGREGASKSSLSTI